MKILKYKVAGALYQAETGPQAQVGDQVKLFLDTAVNPDFPEYVFGVIQPGIKKVDCDSYTIYSIGYTLEFDIHQDDVAYVESTAAVDVVAANLEIESLRAVAAENALAAAVALKAPITNAALVTPTATTPATNDNDTSVATTAFVQAQPAVRYTAQTLSGPQQIQAQTNIGVVNVDFTNTILIDGDGAPAFDWNNRVLKSGAGTDMFGWYAPGILSFSESVNFQFGTVTGTQIATSAAQKTAFHGAAPVIQRSGATQADVVTTAATNTTPYGYSTQAQADAVITLLNEIRAALVQKGLIKGSA